MSEELELTSDDVVEELNQLDDPFQDVPFQLSQQPKRAISTMMQCVVPCPRGEELVDPSWLEEATVVMSRQQLEDLLLKESLLANLHTRPTQRSMQAVAVASSRPPPESLVTVLGEEP